ncbi:MAG: restriction endonuclease subunit S [Defluviitaleaceae bacterium]|nr:restriction endonuclease subunit S [Defluviitaleaceae bacterium]
MNTKQLRQKILDLAIRGKLVPQDPNDEPAEVLLGRVRKEKGESIVPIKNDESPFDLPKNWIWIELGKISEIVTGNTPSKNNKTYYGNEYPFYKPTDLDMGFNVFAAGDMLSEKGFEISRKLPANTVLVTCIGATIGKTGIIRTSGCSNQQINAIVPKTDTIAEYIYFVCISDFFQNQIVKSSSATTLPIINKRNFEKLLFPLPPLAEQHRIVAAIESAFAVIDEIERNKADLQAAVATAKQKILSLAISGKLVPQDPSDEPASVLLDRIKAEREKLIKAGKIRADKRKKDTPITRDNSHYEKLPLGWELITIGEMFDVIGGGTPPTTNDNYWGEGVPWISSADIDEFGNVTPRRKVTKLGLENSTTNVVPKGSVIVVTRVGLGKIATLNCDMCFSQDSQALIPLCSDVIFSKFLHHYLYQIMQTLKLFGRGTTIQGITKKQLTDVVLFLPPLAEQKRIVAAVETAFEELDNIMQNIRTHPQ